LEKLQHLVLTASLEASNRDLHSCDEFARGWTLSLTNSLVNQWWYVRSYWGEIIRQLLACLLPLLSRPVMEVCIAETSLLEAGLSTSPFFSSSAVYTNISLLSV
jgi:hypothetical protein